MDKPIPIGTQTRWGEVVAVGCVGNERYYWIERRSSHATSVSMIDAMTLEQSLKGVA